MNKQAKKDQSKAHDSLHVLYDEEVPTGSVKISVYEVLFQLFHSTQVSGKISNYKKIRFVLSNLFQSFQMIGILFTRQDIKNWGTYNMVWDAFQYIRLDYLASELGVFSQISFALEIVLVLQLAGFLLLVFALFHKKMPPSFIFFILKVSFVLTVFVFGLPTQIFIQSLFLFPFSELHKEGWFENIPFALLAMASHVFLNVLLLIGSSEIRHTTNSIYSRSCSHLELATFTVRLVSVTYFVVNGNSHMIFLSVVVIIGELFLVHQCVTHEYYYSHFANQVKVFSSLIVLTSAIAVMVGNYSDSAGACVLIFLLVTPSVSTGFLRWMPNSSERKPSVKKLTSLAENPRQFATFLDVEKVLRPFFIHRLSEHKDLVLKAVCAYFRATRKNRSSRLVVWETDYCFESLKNERLARIKLTKRLICHYSFEGDFQAFILLNHIVHNGTHYFQEIDYLQFRVKLDDTREKDAGFCKNFLELMEELTEKKPKTTIIHGIITNLSTNLKKIEQLYDHLCEEYRANREVLDLCKSFLTDIMRKEEKAKFLTDKYGELIDNESNMLELFDSKTALMMVSGNYRKLGYITYANECLIQLLQDPNLIDKNIEELVPPPLSYKHYRFLEHFLYTCTEAKLKVPKSFFMLTAHGFIIEVYLKIKCIALNSYPVFIFTIRPKNKNREVVIFDNDGIITSHTQNVANILRLKNYVVNGFNIEEFMMNNSFCGYPDSSYFIANNHRVQYGERKLFSSTIKFYTFHKDFSRIDSKSNLKSVPLKKRVSMNKKTFRRSDAKYVQMRTGSLSASNVENDEIISKRNSRQSKESENEGTKILKLLDLPVKIINQLTICSVCLVLIVVTFVISLSVYLLYNVDPELLLNSIKTTSDMKYSLLKIANEARLVDLINYPDTFSDTVVPFQNFKNYNKKMIELLSSCDKEHTIYDNILGYWEESELKYTNLVDFSNKIFAYGYDYFSQKETDRSYKFLMTNSGGVAYKYFAHVLNYVDSSIQTTRDTYALTIQSMTIISSVLIVIVLAISIFLNFRLRDWAIKYWDSFVKYLSESHLSIRSVFVSRLELAHRYKNVIEMYKPFRKARWTKPYISVFKYIWRSLLLGLLIFVFFLSLMLYIGKLRLAIDERIELAIKLGDSNAEMQALNFWTREMMYKGSLQTLLADFNPLENTQEEFARTHRELDKLLKVFSQTKGVQFTDEEVEMLFDRSKFENTYFISGLHGNIKALLLESRYFAYFDGNIESGYKEFLDSFLKVDDFFNYFFKENIAKSVDFINDIKRNLIILSIGFLLFLMSASLVLFVPFAREEKAMIQHKHSLIEIIRLRNNFTR